MALGLLDTVFLVGAGASACANLPVMQNFRSVAHEVYGSAAFANPDFKAYFERALSTWDHVYRHLDIESYFVLRDLRHRIIANAGTVPPLSEVQWLGDLSPTTRVGQDTFDRHFLEYMIAKVILEKTKNADLSPYRRFVAAALEANRRSAFITTNWDDLLDRALIESGLKMDIGYSSHEDAVVSMTSGQPLLKLHGSTGWWFCTYCKSMSIERDETVSIGRWENKVGKVCSNCNKGPLRPAMVPPISQKLTDVGGLPGAFANIWNETIRQIMFCRRLVIVGYSFPVTDVEVSALLGDAVRANDKLQAIEIVTRPKSRKDMRDYVGRIARVFSPRFGDYRIGPLRYRPIDLLITQQGFEKWSPLDALTKYQRYSIA